MNDKENKTFIDSKKDAEAALDYDKKSAVVDDSQERGNWSGKLDFLLSCLSYAVGLGNLWRFPYLCYRNGGGAFLIPYVLMLLLTGVPLFFMELSFGQYASEGVISIWKVCPLFQGIGWGMFLVSLFISIYYNMVIAWTLFYFFSSLRADVPWRNCVNTENCGMVKHLQVYNCTENLNGLWYNNSCVFSNQLINGNITFAAMQNWTNVTNNIADSKINYASDEYFHDYVLEISKGFHEMGTPRWRLALCLLFAWVLVGLCLIKGIKSAGRAVYFTATFPYLVLIILLIRCLTLKGAADGISFYIIPKWEKLLTAKIWGDAAVQIFFSLSPCWGGLITLASYNKFHNNCLRDAIVVSIGNCLTSFFAGFVIFGIVGFMAQELHMPIEKVVRPGAGLAFIVYPEVVSRLPISPLWAILFFLMLITLGLGTQFAVVTTVHTTLLDVFPDVLRVGKRPMLLIVAICIFGFTIGLSCTTRAGMYLLQLIDNFAATYSVLIIGLFECCVLSWIYGVDRFLKDIQDMIGNKPWIIFKYMWKYITPVILVAIMIFTWIDYKRSFYGDYTFPAWADGIGWLISFASVSPIPIVIVYKLLTTQRLLNESVFDLAKRLCQPTNDWGPNTDPKYLDAEKRYVLYNDSPAISELNIHANEKLQSVTALLEKSEAPIAMIDESPSFKGPKGDANSHC